ncbi:MAG: thiamine-phosphate kinase [Planctomycetota bacterium]|jgi:thiamine-monophosphate kinase|nr:thiamine-phosphate kinase [Planctomycetota bacterium]
MREFDLIEALRDELPVPAGARGVGDDCCLWQPGGTTCLSTDTVVAGTHFAPDADPAAIGRKAAAAAISDLAAMAARPVGATVALTRPADYDDLALMRGCHLELARHACPLLGGDTTRGPVVTVTVTVWGEAAGERLVLREGGCLGDILVVTGALGGSLRNGRHMRPEPRLAEAAWLATRPEIHAMMDLSDGLAADAPRLARASGYGCVLLPADAPVHDDVPPMSDTARAACCDGEDYELLFAVDARQWPSLQIDWPFAVPINRIGWLIDQAGCWVEDTRGCLQAFDWDGFQH